MAVIRPDRDLDPAVVPRIAPGDAHGLVGKVLRHTGNQLVAVKRRGRGAEKRQRKLAEARFPGVDENGLISLPPAWEGKVTAGRLACVAHTWAMSSLVREDPAAAKARKTAAARAMMIPYFTALILLGMLATGLLKFQIALAIGLACWAFFTFSALPTQFREWKAAEIAKSGLKEAGLWPLLPSDAMAVEQCLKALSWCNVAGFRRILPR